MSYRVISFPESPVTAAPPMAAAPSRSRKAASKLREAAQLVETTAFEIATDHPASVISQLIMMSADLYRLAHRIETSADDA